MKIKQAGGIAAVITVLGWAGIAQADHLCVAEIAEIKYKALYMLCAKDGGQEVEALWQFKGKNGDGCEVHKKLAKQLYVERDEYDANTMPPYKGAKTKKGNNEATGAANALIDHKFEVALLHLDNFVYTIESAARAAEGKEAGAMSYAVWGKGMKARVEACMPAVD